MHVSQDSAHFLPSQDDGEMLGALGVDEIVEPGDLEPEDLTMDVAADPRDVGLLGTAAVVARADRPADTVEQPRPRRRGWLGLTNDKALERARPDGVDASRPPSSRRAL